MASLFFWVTSILFTADTYRLIDYLTNFLYTWSSSSDLFRVMLTVYAHCLCYC